MTSTEQPILILEDDTDDQELITAAFQQIGVTNKIIFFEEAPQALIYLLQTTEQPFLILTDMNLPGINGLEFQKKIQDNEYLRRKCIPFIFFTTTNNRKVVEQAYDQQVQGFFQKPANFNELAEILRFIVDYWSRCLHPNK
jgi:CheY-like chemotaxis protein